MSDPATIPRARPRLWPFLLAFIILAALWVLALEVLMHPTALATVSTPPLQRLLYWLLPPLLLVGGFYGFRWGQRAVQIHRAQATEQAEQQAKADLQKAEAAAAQAQKDHDHYSLEIYGLGLSVEKFRQNTIWEALHKATTSSILPSDPKAYPWSEQEKMSSSGKRASDAYIAAIQDFPEKWELPFLLGGPPLGNLENPFKADYLKAGLAGARTGGGMHYHRFRTVEQVYAACLDPLPGKAFGLFDQYPDLPALAIATEDGLALRDSLRAPTDPRLIKNGYREPDEMTESMTVLLLGRRDRVDLLRPSATDALIQDIQVPIETVIAYKGDKPEPYEVLSYDDAPPEPQLPDHYNNLRPYWEQQGGAPVAFKPSRFVRRPWCKEQLFQFDQLRVLARLHRPQTAQYLKPDGKPLGRSGREKAFLEAWQAALATLPPGQQPTRIIYDFGPKGASRMAPLFIALNATGSQLDVHGKDSLDLTERLGDTGANSPNVGLALGVIGVQKEGGVSAVVNLRQDDHATITMISPPTPEDLVHRKTRLNSKYLGTSEDYPR